jgi:hypothetical protein
MVGAEILKKNRGEKLHDLGLGDDFKEKTPKHRQENKSKQSG